jgi:hypothetical protein
LDGSLVSWAILEDTGWISIGPKGLNGPSHGTKFLK